MRIREPSITPATPRMRELWIDANSAASLVCCSMNVGKLGDRSADRISWTASRRMLEKDDLSTSAPSLNENWESPWANQNGVKSSLTRGLSVHGSRPRNPPPPGPPTPHLPPASRTAIAPSQQPPHCLRQCLHPPEPSPPHIPHRLPLDQSPPHLHPHSSPPLHHRWSRHAEGEPLEHRVRQKIWESSVCAALSTWASAQADAPRAVHCHGQTAPAHFWARKKGTKQRRHSTCLAVSRPRAALHRPCQLNDLRGSSHRRCRLRRGHDLHPHGHLAHDHHHRRPRAGPTVGRHVLAAFQRPRRKHPG